MSERVRFTVDGRPAEAEAGESLLAALWNAGRRAVRTSVRGEPRGPLCGMGVCFECRVTIDGEPHRRACLEPVRGGMEVVLSSPPEAGASPEAQAGDATHHDPARPAGIASRAAAEIVVVGAGPAGIAAAIHAAEAGARTLLLDEQPRPGGQVWRHRGEPPPAARPWLDRFARSSAALLAGATVVDAAGRELLVAHEGRPVRVTFERLVLATGSRELFLPFAGWTLPGVVGVGGVQALLTAGARLAGTRVVVAGSGPLLPAVAAVLGRAGARVNGIAEQAPLPRLAAFAASLWREPGKLAEGLGYAAGLAGVSYRPGAWVREVVGDGVAEAALVTDGRREWRWDCDVLACAFGLVPSLELPRLLGCAVTAAGVVVDAMQQTTVPGVYAAGELLGIAGADRALTTGAIAGLAAADRPVPARLARRREREDGFASRLARAFAPRGELLSLARPDTIVCRCEDVALRHLAEAASLREAKLHTRAGMGPCQGRVCGPALSLRRGLPPDSVRSPLVPVPVAVLLAGDEGSTETGAAGVPGPGPRDA